MSASSITEIIRAYIHELEKNSLPVHRVVLFGSQSVGDARSDSDIDCLVLSKNFDGDMNRSDIGMLWKIAARVDSRIEPHPCGIIQWEEDDVSIIIEQARREGRVITAA